MYHWQRTTRALNSWLHPYNWCGVIASPPGLESRILQKNNASALMLTAGVPAHIELQNAGRQAASCTYPYKRVSSPNISQERCRCSIMQALNERCEEWRGMCGRGAGKRNVKYLQRSCSSGRLIQLCTAPRRSFHPLLRRSLPLYFVCLHHHLVS